MHVYNHHPPAPLPQHQGCWILCNAVLDGRPLSFNDLKIEEAILGDEFDYPTISHDRVDFRWLVLICMKKEAKELQVDLKPHYLDEADFYMEPLTLYVPIVSFCGAILDDTMWTIDYYEFFIFLIIYVVLDLNLFIGTGLCFWNIFCKTTAQSK